MTSPRDLPLAPGDRHLKALRRLGWEQTRRSKGSHVVLEKEGEAPTLCIPCHKGRDVKRNLLAKQLKLAGISIDDYLAAYK